MRSELYTQSIRAPPFSNTPPRKRNEKLFHHIPQRMLPVNVIKSADPSSPAISHCDNPWHPIGPKLVKSSKSNSSRFTRPMKSVVSKPVTAEPGGAAGNDSFDMGELFSYKPVPVGWLLAIPEPRPCWNRIRFTNQIIVGHAPVVC